MSKFISVLTAPLELFFGGGEDFEHGHPNQSTGLLLRGLPAVVLAIVGVGLLVTSEMGAGSALVEDYNTYLQDTRAERTKLIGELKQESNMKLASSGQRLVFGEDDPRSKTLKELIEGEEVCLKKLSAIEPGDSNHLFELAKLYLSTRDKQQLGSALMQKLAPNDASGHPQAHILKATEFLKLKAESAVNEERLRKLAIKQLDFALIRDPNNPRALDLKGRVLLGNMQFKNAKEVYTQLFDLQPSVYPVLIKLNNILKLPPEANTTVLHLAKSRFKRQLERLTEPSDERLQTLERLVDCLQLLKDFPAAETILVNEVKRFENDAEKMLEIGIQRWSNKLRAFIRLRESASLGKLTIENREQQLKLLREAFELDPNNARLQTVLANLPALDVPGIKQDAVAIYDPSKMRNTPAAVDNAQGLVSLNEERFDDALFFFNRATSKESKNPEFLNNLAYTRLQQASSRLDQVQEKLTQAQQRLDDEDSQENKNAVTNALQQVEVAKIAELRAATEAVRDIDRALTMITASSPMRQFIANFLDTRGKALMIKQDYNSAIADFLRASLTRPNDAELTKLIRDCYELDQQTARVEAWEQRYQKILRLQKLNTP